MRRFFAMAAATVFLTGPSFAVEPDEMLADPALEARARDISRELRCVVCQSQSIDDSSAPLAKDMRILVRERIAAGDSDEDVYAFLVARYGDYVLLKPPVQGNTLLLWAAPAIIFLAAAAAAAAYMTSMQRADDRRRAEEEAEGGESC